MISHFRIEIDDGEYSKGILLYDHRERLWVIGISANKGLSLWSGLQSGKYDVDDSSKLIITSVDEL